jgi:hypothetical protein
MPPTPRYARGSFSTSLVVTYSRSEGMRWWDRPGPAALTFRFTVSGATSTSFKFARNVCFPVSVKTGLAWFPADWELPRPLRRF